MLVDQIIITYLEKLDSLLLQDYQIQEAEQRTERNLQNITKKEMMTFCCYDSPFSQMFYLFVFLCVCVARLICWLIMLGNP